MGHKFALSEGETNVKVNLPGILQGTTKFFRRDFTCHQIKIIKFPLMKIITLIILSGIMKENLNDVAL